MAPLPRTSRTRWPVTFAAGGLTALMALAALSSSATASPRLTASAVDISATALNPVVAHQAPVPPGADLPLNSPVTPVSLMRLAAIPSQNWNPGHRGVDLAASVGQEVRAPAAGIVTFAGVVVDRPVITITLAGGLRSTVEPVEALVEVGASVVRGESLGTVATTAGHCAPHTCIHWGVRRGETYLDPLDLMRGYGPVQLLAVS